MKKFSLIIKTTALFTAAAIMISFGGCFDYSFIDETQDMISSAEDIHAEPSEDVLINLSYYTNDSLNPFTAQGECNRNLTSLMYDSLFEIDNSFKASPLIAESITETDGNTLNIKIKSNLYFTDGSPLTADDVVFSFETAKKSERYKDALSCFKNAQISGTNNLVFELKEPRPDAVNNLTFPVIKSDSLPQDDDLRAVPIGSGRYQTAYNDNKELYLKYNPNRLGGYTPRYANIGLTATGDDKSYRSLFALGHTNVIIDSFSSGEYVQTIGASSKINLTNFVYLICNKSKKVFDDVNVKKAISMALDRVEICDYSFISFGKAAYTPFHPDYYKLSDLSSGVYGTEKAKKFLDSAGYNNINPTYNFRHKDGNILEFNLIVCKDNGFKLSAAQKIKEQLDKVSIQINIVQYSQEDYISAVKNGRYDIYLGECKLTDDLDLSSFFTSVGTVSYGIDTQSQSADMYREYSSGTASIGEFLDAFSEEMPLIPLLYRCGSATSNAGMAVADSAVVSDYYHNADKWKAIND